MAQKSPLAWVKEEFGGKDKLVDKIVALLGSGDEPKDDMRRRLLGAANKKLVRLHGVATKVKELGGKDQLATVAAEELGRAKDKDYVVKLGTMSSGRLLDILQSARRRNLRKGAAAPAKSAPSAMSAVSDGSATPTRSPASAAAKSAARAKSAAVRAGAASATAAKSKRAPATKAAAKKAKA